MPVTASQVKDIFKELELEYDDKGEDRDGDYIFATGFPAKEYEDFDGRNSFMCQLQLLEKVNGTGNDSEIDKRIAELTLKLIEIDPKDSYDEFQETQRELKKLKEGQKEAAYDMIAIYISRLNTSGLGKRDTLEVINEVNARVKCARLAIDSHDDVISYYQLIIEDANFTKNQFIRLLSVTMSAVNHFGKLVSDKVNS